jgi:hypothetical protein
MLKPDEILPFDEEVEAAELLRALPEIRHNVAPAARDEELGLLSLLDWREPMPPAWAHHAA